MNRITVLTFILILLNCQYLSSQEKHIKTIHELTPPSPETAKLGEYGQHSIDYFSGKANVQIPLHSFDFEGLSIPLNLSYISGNGILTNQDATWAGLGWILSIEPIITRKINGLDDLLYKPAASGYYRGFPYTNIALPRRSDELSYAGDLMNIIQTNTINLVDLDPLEGYLKWDIKPDVFTVNIFGEQISFILTQKELSGGVIKANLIDVDSKYKIGFDEASGDFEVVDPSGFKFIFNVKEYSVSATGQEQGFPFSSSIQVIPGLNNKVITGWKLSKIISPTQKEINFTYSQDRFIVDTPIFSVSHSDRICNYAQFLNQAELPKIIYSYQAVETAHQIKYLKEIKSDHFTIEFNTDNRNDIYRMGERPNYTIFDYVLTGSNNLIAQKLNQIKIKDANNVVTKNITLNHGYFNENSTEPLFSFLPKDFLRLRLDNVLINDEMSYVMEYNNSFNLPQKSTKSKDFWGYYNSNPAGSLLPMFLGSIYCKKDVIFGQTSPFYKRVNRLRGGNGLVIGERRPDTNRTKTGILEKIIYPTKGYSKYVYEPHTIEVDEELYNELSLYKYADDAEYESLSSSVDLPHFSEIIHVPNPTEVKMSVLFACAADFQTPETYESHQKCNIEYGDKNKIAWQLINTDNNAVVKEGYFTNGVSCSNCDPIKPIDNYDEWYIVNGTFPLNPGNYKIMTKGLKHISNFFDQNDETWSPNHPENTNPPKQYNYGVQATLSIPKMSLVEHETYTKENLGGVRIKEIENYESNGNLINKKIFKYDSIINGNRKVSTGKMIAPLSFFSTRIEGRSVYGSIYHNCQNPMSYYHEGKYFILNSDNKLGSLGQSVHYSFVTEENIHVSNPMENNGAVKNSYNFIPNDYNENGNNSIYLRNVSAFVRDPNSYGEYRYYEPFQSKGYKNGDLLSTDFVDHVNVTQKKSTYSYDYPYILDSDHLSNTVSGNGDVEHFKVSYLDCNFKYIRNSYDLYTYQATTIQNTLSPLIKEETKETFGSQEMITTQNMSYNSTHQVKDVSTTNSLGENLRTEYYYPPDLTSYYEQSALMNKLVSRNQIASPVITKTFENGTATAEERTHYAHFYENGNPQAGFILPQYVYAKKGEIGTTSLPADRKIIYDYYDDKGNLTEYTLDNGIPVSIIWGYNAQYPIAKVEGLRNSQINSYITTLQGLSNAGTLSATSFDALRNYTNGLTNHAVVTGYVYKPLVGVTAIVQPNGQPEYYQYDSFGRLQEVYVMEYDTNGNPTIKKVVRKLEYNYKD